MAELPSLSQSLPPKSETEIQPSQSDPQFQSTSLALSASTPLPPADLNPIPNVNPPPVLLPTSVAVFPPPTVSGVTSSLQPPVHLFRPPVPQFSAVPGAVSYQNSLTSAPGMVPPAPGSMMQYQVPLPGQPPNQLFRPFAPNGYAAMPPPVPAPGSMMQCQVPLPGQPPNQLFRPFAPNGYAAMPPPGVPGYTAQYTAMARPMYPPRPPGALGILPTISRAPFPLIPGVRPIFHPIIRPGGVLPIASAEKPQTTVYVGKIAPSVSNEVMLSMLQFCGPVKSWKRLQDPTDGTLKRFGLCEFESAEGVLRALRLLNKLNLDGQELSLKFNEATKGYLLRYIERKTDIDVAKKKGEDASAMDQNDSLKVGGDEIKKDGADLGKGDESNLSKSDDAEQVKKDEDYRDFGLVTDEDREADKVAMEKISEIIEERLKSLPPPPPLTDGLRNASIEMPVKSRDGDSGVKNDAEDKHDDETTSDTKTTSDYDKTEISAPDRNRRYDNRRNRDRDRDVKGDRERELDRNERDAERERIRIERELRRKIEDAEREYERRLKDWEAREREREKARQREKEKEKDRERKRKKEILLDEEEDEEDSRRWNRSVLEDKRKKRMMEKEDDLNDRVKEEEELAEAKKRYKEEKLRELEQDKVQHDSDGGVTENEKQSMTDAEMAESNDRAVHPHIRDGSGYAGKDGTSQVGIIDNSTSMVSVASGTQNNNAPAKKLGFGLSASGKRTAVPSVFHEDEDDDAHKDKNMRPLIPIDYSTEEMQAIQSPQAEAPPQPNLTAAAEYAKRISSGKDKPELERERSRRSHDRSSHRDRDRYDEDDSRSNKEKTVDREKDRQNGFEKLKALDNKKLLDAKQLIDMIPKTKEDLFAYKINWSLYDEHKLHERMRPWISKKITEFLGEEEKTLVDYIVSSTQEHVKASEMLETLESILDEEAEMFLLKMWRMLIFEIKKVETGLHVTRSRT